MISLHPHTTSAPACPQGWGPFPELFHCISFCFPTLCSKHFSLLPSRGLDSSPLIQNPAGERGILTCGRQQDLSPAPENCAGPGRDVWVEKQSIGLIPLYRDVVTIAEPTYVIIDYILAW